MESLLKDECYECYICMEPCKTKSPCLCETNVHGKCLEQYITLTKQEFCTICLDTYPIIRKLPRKRPCNLVGAGVVSIAAALLNAADIVATDGQVTKPQPGASGREGAPGSGLDYR